MNRYRKLTLAALVITFLVVSSPKAQAQIVDQRMRVAFSGPVEVPGKVLPAGNYIFEAMEPGHLTRVFSADGRHFYGNFLTIPEVRLEPAETPTILFGENVNGAPERVEAWFYPGNLTGNEFIYPKASSRKTVASLMRSMTDETGHAVAQVAYGAVISSEFAGKYSERVAVKFRQGRQPAH